MGFLGWSQMLFRADGHTGLMANSSTYQGLLLDLS
jgi:hypothetical protein